MNLYELDALISRCTELNDTELVEFYLEKRKTLVATINQKLARSL